MSLPAPSAAVRPAPWRQRVPQLLWALVPAALVVALAVHTLQSSRALHQRRAELLSQNLATALAHTVAADIEKIDVALGLIADLAQRQLGEPRPDLGALDRGGAGAAAAPSGAQRHPHRRRRG